MKKVSLYLIVFLWFTQAVAQDFPADGISYQAMLTQKEKVTYGTKLQNMPVANKQIQVRFELSQLGSTVFTDEHQLTTDINGIFSCIIGTGNTTPFGTKLSELDWGKDSVIVSVFINAGDGESLFSKQKLWSTAYAMYTPIAGRALNDNDTNSTNELQYLNLVGDSVKISAVSGGISLKPWTDGIAKNAQDLVSEKSRAEAAETKLASEIKTLENSINAAQNDLSYLNDSLKAHRTEINGLKNGVNQNSKLISTHTDSITFHRTELNKNRGDINKNKADIAINKTDIASNKVDIATNKTDIATNKTDIAANKSNIKNNSDSIAVHRTELNKNRGDINKNKTDIATNKTDISANKVDIATNKSNIKNNSDSITVHRTELNKNRGDINKNKTDIATNKTEIASNKVDIAVNKTDIATNKIDIATNKSNIKNNSDSIIVHRTELNKNRGDINKNKSDLATLKAGLDNHLIDDKDLDNTNELSDLSFNSSTYELSNSNPKTGGNKVNLSGLKDNLGNHKATQNLELNGKYLSNDGGNEGISIDNDGRVGIGTNSPSSGAILDVNSTTGAFLPPRMTESQRNSINKAAAGAVIYNKTNNKLQVYVDSVNGDYNQLSGSYLYDGPFHAQTFRPTVSGKLLNLRCVSGQRFTFVTYLNCTVYEGDPSGTLTLMGSADNTIKMTNPTGTTFPPKVNADFTFGNLNKVLEVGKTYTFVFAAKDSATGAERQCWFLTGTSSSNNMGEYWRGSSLSGLTMPNSAYDMEGYIKLKTESPKWANLNEDFTFTEVDGSVGNELQDITFNAGTKKLTLSTPKTAGNEVDLSSLSDNLGNHKAVQNIDLNGKFLTDNSGDTLTIAVFGNDRDVTIQSEDEIYLRTIKNPLNSTNGDIQLESSDDIEISALGDDITLQSFDDIHINSGEDIFLNALDVVELNSGNTKNIIVNSDNDIELITTDNDYVEIWKKNSSGVAEFMYALPNSRGQIGQFLQRSSDGSSEYFSNWSSYKLPTSDGSNGQTLVTNGSGNVSWVNSVKSLKDLTDAYSYGTGSIMLGSKTTGTINNANYNFSFGSNALKSITEGDYNIAIGASSLEASTTSSFNVAVGSSSLLNVTTGQYNTAIGQGSGSVITTGSNNMYLGYQAQATSSNASNEIVIGNSSVKELYTAADMNAPAFTTTSDRRLKKDIKPITSALSLLMQLEPVSYSKKRSIQSEVYDINEYGFIAQDLKEVFPLAVKENNDAHKTLGVNYISLIPVLTKATQEQQQIIKSQQEIINKQQQLLDQLIKRVEILESK